MGAQFSIGTGAVAAAAGFSIVVAVALWAAVPRRRSAKRAMAAGFALVVVGEAIVAVRVAQRLIERSGATGAYMVAVSVTAGTALAWAVFGREIRSIWAEMRKARREPGRAGC